MHPSKRISFSRVGYLLLFIATIGICLVAAAQSVPVVTGDGLYLVREVQWEGGSAAPAEKVLIKKENMLCES